MNITDNKNISVLKKPKKVNVSLEKWSANKIVFRVLLLITCFKVLLIPTYRSTDFEVHRNWLAITHSLPLNEWYVNSNSQWTLDYPPLFAWFEYFLSHIAKFIDPEMLKIENLNYASSNTIFFQRGSVIFLDLIFAYGVKEVGKVFCSSFDEYVIFIVLSLCNMGLLVVDHIHFQYNGFLLGILLLAIANVSKVHEQRPVLLGTLWFALLLNLKHIYLYVAPVFIIWLLGSYCMNTGSFFRRLFILGSIVIFTLIISFGPFVSQLTQVISRLFPFKRGLVHAYWAPNAWALYIVIDKIISIIFKQLGWIKVMKSAVMTGGLVQEQTFLVLPTPTPLVTFLLTLSTMIPALYCLLIKKDYTTNPKQFVRCLVLCALCSFMFGWHVHEKAVLTAIIPLCVLAAINKDDARIYLILSSAGHAALLPLLYPSNLTPLKILLILVYMIATFLTFSRKFKLGVLHSYEYIYVINLPALTVYETILHKLIFGDKLPFLPLALTSVYCAIGRMISMAALIPKVVRTIKNQNVYPGIYAIQSCDYSSQPRIIKNPTTASLKRGTGGRSSFNGIVCTIYGCSGFIGSALSIRLGRIGTQLILAHRCDPYHIRELKVGGDLGQVFFHPFDFRDEESLFRTMKYSNVVVNLVGANVETSNFSFEDVNVKGARTLAKIAKQLNVERFIHMSCLNAEEKPTPMILSQSSRLLKSKWQGEVAVREEFPEATIIRPSVVYGRGDNFLHHYLNQKRVDLYSVFPLWHKGEKTEKQPVYLHDVMNGIVEIVKNPDTAGKTYQFVGPKRYTLNKLVNMMLDEKYKHMLDRPEIVDMKYSPYSWLKTSIMENIYKIHPVLDLTWEVLEFHHATDKIDRNLPTLEDLGIMPTDFESRMEWEITPHMPSRPRLEKLQGLRPLDVKSIPK